MKIYRIISTSYRSEKVIANDVKEAINKFLSKGKENTEHRLSTIVKVEYLEDFDYIQ